MSVPRSRALRAGVMVLALAAGAMSTACDTTYEFDDLDLGGDPDVAPREKSNNQFVRGLFADLLGRTPGVLEFTLTLDGREVTRFPVDEQTFLVDALDGVGDPTPMRNLIAAGLTHSAEIRISDKVDVSDPSVYIAGEFRRLLGREPNPYELRAWVDEWRADAAVGPRAVIRALIASREYQSF